NEANRILDEGGDVPLALVNEARQLEAQLQGVEAATANLGRSEKLLADNRERQAELVRQINALAGPGVNVPNAVVPPPIAPPPGGTTPPAGTPSDPVVVTFAGGIAGVADFAPTGGGDR